MLNAHETGTQAVITSAHFERLTPRVSRLGFLRGLHQFTTLINVMKNKSISDIKKNQSQCW